ncbi:uncharacterized protein LOC142983691 isoform X2 [Anticarsia gemmatalis]|uniref:uncharacterized protein LOC142983691 isoform X2 n=1 Tax=Anticarsia gemmatalis TaxID=129554 RepID=UPI003F7715B9
MMILKLLPLLIIVHSSGCSQVKDTYDHRGIYLADFCPRMEFCAEGAHVMCMYYDPNHAMGPRCSNPQNITMTAELANQLLDITNAIRSKIAFGKETGHFDAKLPRGYGVFRVRWDNELATFAQVLANQCVLRHDLCRATKRFADPGQTAGLVRFTHPEWMPISKVNKPMVPGLNHDKLTYSVSQTLKSWYSQKVDVTVEMVNNYPDWSLKPELGGRLYLEMIHGSTTHMGCGMSAYTEFAYYDSRRALNYNSVQMICNFSSRPKTGEVTYNTSRPSDVYSTPCGCPVGTEEDSDCLCSYIVEEPTSPSGVDMSIQVDTQLCSNPENNCESTVVLLPIFTVEDAPPEKIIDRAGDVEDLQNIYDSDRADNKSSMLPRTKSMEILDFFEEAEREHHNTHLHSAAAKPHKTVMLPPDPEPAHPPATQSDVDWPKHREPKRRKIPKEQHYTYPEPKPKPKPKYEAPPPRPAYVPHKHFSTSKKSSIFNRGARFSLPSDKRLFDPYKPRKADVKPRKDFKNIQKVVNDYIKRRNNKFDFKKHETNYHDVVFKHTSAATEATFETEPPTETILNKVEESVMNFNPYIKQKANVTVEDTPKHIDENYEENDNKLMNLLDTLEREVKHIELDGTEKEIFDAKIRKIYGSVVGKPVASLNSVAKPRGQVQQTPLPLPLPTVAPPSPPVAQHTLPPFLPPLSPPGEIPSDLDGLGTDLGESDKAYLDHKSDSDHSLDFRSGHESDRFSEDEKNYNKLGLDTKRDYMKNKHILDRKYIDKFDKRYKKNIDDKNLDFTENKSLNDMFGNDRAMYSDIEQKYNERLRKYSETRKHGDSGRKYSDMLSSRNQNNLIKYDNFRYRPNSGEDRKMRGFDKYRDRQRMTRGNSERGFYRNTEDNMKHNMGDLKRKSYPGKEFDHEDPLSENRRRFYQEKLENIERRLHNARSFRHRTKDDRGGESPALRMRPNRGGVTDVKSRAKAQGDSFYVPDRARFIHGF